MTQSELITCQQACGVTLAYACLIRGTGKIIALYDRDADRVRAEVLDLRHGLQFVPMATVDGSDDVEVCRGADVLVLTVGGVPGPGQTRLDLAAGSVAGPRVHRRQKSRDPSEYFSSCIDMRRLHALTPALCG